ncbi:unnamed protein product [Didymodactylos carnosus]|uniref:N(6)-adenosine-methyltransferase non-catalytic subunit METTL14 n=1 Tax=Didymodactylos carnosus TaxID=1234261 RepID=A0A813WZN8_9BILA|nr:unnamed protein product [Didymodactylos carnosus]CAF0858114.1 unnamed protein product [Didymodactylos carnosus]CAF3497904.1 unnamed protein product [Didymodactylos carnosus]CAF3645784.1 unnamed protein product [Didymodactylos carnosus]
MTRPSTHSSRRFASHRYSNGGNSRDYHRSVRFKRFRHDDSRYERRPAYHDAYSSYNTHSRHASHRHQLRHSSPHSRNRTHQTDDKHRRSDSESNDLIQYMKRRNNSIRRTMASTFGMSSHHLSKLLINKCDEAEYDAVTKTKQIRYKRKNADDTSPIQTSRVITDEVHFFDQMSRDEEDLDEGPLNDYNQHFVNSGHRPQNYIRDAGLQDRFEEYPKLRELIRLKDEHIAKTGTPPMYMKCDLLNFSLADLDCEFDVILIEPPLQEYKRTHGVHFDRYWSWDEIMKLDVEAAAAQRSFVFLWCGSAEGLDLGRQCLKKWGFRRCEDICWVKTNRSNPRHVVTHEPGAIFQRTKEHCLMGIRGTVRRSVDSDFIHANVDIDLIITEEPEWGDANKPLEIYHIIEHFCLGRRRLHLFSRESTIRRGWLSIGPQLSTSNYDKKLYKLFFETTPGAGGDLKEEGRGHLTGVTERIEQLRPKSPPPKGVKVNLTGVAQNNGAQQQNQIIDSQQQQLQQSQQSQQTQSQQSQQQLQTIMSIRPSMNRQQKLRWNRQDAYPLDDSPRAYDVSPTRPYMYDPQLQLSSEYDYALAGGPNEFDYYAQQDYLVQQQQNERNSNFRT